MNLKASVHATSDAAIIEPRLQPRMPMSEEEIARLGDAIAELSARIQAATYELLVLIRQFDERACCNDGGCRSCAHWLSWRIGLAPGAAREKVRVARALARLPLISAAMERGEISYSKVRALTRIATPDNESRPLGAAQDGTAAHVERLARAWRRADRLDEARETARRHQQRYLQTWVDEDGMLVIRGRLTPELGAVVQRALEATGCSARARPTRATMPRRRSPPPSAARMPSGSSPRVRWRVTWIAGRQAIAIRWCSMSTRPR
ncbi:MAG: DUF222 domain-containing protein [Luteitalea sp.]|nr:DUF222 domain-containing protein [Luteitalea sp.]